MLQKLNIQGENMRYTFCILSAILLLSGCEKKDIIVDPSSQSSKSASQQIGNILYTFTTSKVVYNISDTLKAGLIADNIGKDTEMTVMISCMGFPWTLKNANGMTIMQKQYGVICNSISRAILAPGQYFLMDEINVVIPDDSSLIGSDTLSMMNLSVDISIH